MIVLNGYEALTVEDLQEKLSQFPPDMPVIVYGEPLEERDIRIVERYYSYHSDDEIEVLSIG